MKSLRIFALGVLAVLLTGCADKNISMPDEFWQNKSQKITVAMHKAPKPEIQFAGQQGLLDYAISSAMTHKLDEHLAKEDLTWYNSLSQEFVTQLRKRNVKASLYPTPLAYNIHQYSTFAVQTGSDKILVVKLEAVGAKRDYYAFIPMGAPQAYCSLRGELLNAQDNKAIWRHTVTISLPVQGDWDQPPSYPNLTKTLHEATKAAHRELLDSFFSGH